MSTQSNFGNPSGMSMGSLPQSVDNDLTEEEREQVMRV